jgi:hypothetical protein
VKWQVALVVGAVVALGMSQGVAATDTPLQGLKVAPLSYSTSLKKGEKQKGVIDISNPSKETVTVTTSVRGFKQVGNDGSLEFFASEQLQQAITPDLQEFTLKGNEAMRMYFLLDGTKLPSGDVFATIFFSMNLPKPENGPTQSVRVGTLLFITNDTPGERQAEITSVSVPFMQATTTVNGSYTIKNTANPVTSTGFFPEVKVEHQPFYSNQPIKSSLVFAGRERSNSFSATVPWPGLYSFRISYGSSYKDVWVLVATPVQLAVAGVVAFALLLGSIRLIRRRRYRVATDTGTPRRKKSRRAR